MLRVGIILFISLCLVFAAMHKGGDYMPNLPYFRINDKEAPERVPDWGSLSDTVVEPARELISEDEDFETINTRLRDVLSATMKRIEEFSPKEKFDRKNGADCKIGDIHIDDTKSFDRLTKSELLKCIQLPDTVQDEMKSLHKSFLSALKEEIIPSYGPQLYKGKGIVMVAGGKFTLIGMPAIKAIRENGDEDIPIEIMVPPDNTDESYFCEQILPELDPSGKSRCVYMEKLFDPSTFQKVKGYQLKPLALLASSFENALLLDADNYVINSISNIFNTSPFKKHGLVLWPDYWRRLHHPSLYDVTGIKVETDNQTRYSFDDVSPPEIYKNENPKNAPFHDLEGTIPDSSTESGQLLVNKSKHLETIILSLYYNYNGPSHYYPLLGQGYAGEGDKDTFALAAKAVHSNQSYYQVKSPVGAMGYWAHKKDETLVLEGDAAPEKEFRGVAMLQHDLEFDYKTHEEVKEEISTKYTRALNKYREQKDTEGTDDGIALSIEFWNIQKKLGYHLADFRSYFKDVPVTFVHSHLPKYNPWEFGKEQDLTFDGRKVMNRHKDEPGFSPIHHGHYRMYNDDFAKLTSYDLELENWSCFKKFICERDNGFESFSYLKQQVESTIDGRKQYDDMCDYINDRVEMLRESTW